MKVLIVSVAPVPTRTSTIVSGIGMRAWGLALGLRAHGRAVTVLVTGRDADVTDEHEGIVTRDITHDVIWADLLAAFDAVVVLFCTGEAVEIAKALPAGVLLILDVYVPWYVEAAARAPEDLVGQYGTFLAEATRFNGVLRRGDLFLCACSSQRHYYAGILGSLGVINPYTYAHEVLLEVPFGVSSRELQKEVAPDPYPRLGIAPDGFTLLWFGGIYPWFDIDPVLDAVERLSREVPGFHFVIVGGLNPHVSEHVFGQGYFRARRRLDRFVGRSVHFVDWVDYDDRIAWFTHADAVVTLNGPGQENEYSWRTRVMDYVAAAVPIITNGGDPLSEQVLREGGGVRTTGTGDDLSKVVRRCSSDRAVLDAAVRVLEELRHSYTWELTTAPLDRRLADLAVVAGAEATFVRQHHLPRRQRSKHTGLEAALLETAHLLRRLREEGLAGTVQVIRDRWSPRVRSGD